MISSGANMLPVVTFYSWSTNASGIVISLVDCYAKCIVISLVDCYAKCIVISLADCCAKTVAGCSIIAAVCLLFSCLIFPYSIVVSDSQASVCDSNDEINEINLSNCLNCYA